MSLFKKNRRVIHIKVFSEEGKFLKEFKNVKSFKITSSKAFSKILGVVYWDTDFGSNLYLTDTANFDIMITNGNPDLEELDD
jgi:hypothetical protein